MTAEQYAELKKMAAKADSDPILQTNILLLGILELLWEISCDMPREPVEVEIREPRLL